MHGQQNASKRLAAFFTSCKSTPTSRIYSLTTLVIQQTEHMAIAKRVGQDAIVAADNSFLIHMDVDNSHVEAHNNGKGLSRAKGREPPMPQVSRSAFPNKRLRSANKVHKAEGFRVTSKGSPGYGAAPSTDASESSYSGTYD
jgi:hypothetical protein